MNAKEENIMNWINITPSILSIAVSIFAIVQSSLIANSSNNEETNG